MTRTSRGSSVGSAASRPSTTSRSTSTCRSGPWQACTCTRAVVAASTRSPAGGRSSRRSRCSRAEQRGRRRSAPGWCVVDAGQAREPQLQLADVAAERGQQRVARRRRRVGSARARGPRRGRRRDACPTARARGAAATGARRGARPSAASTASCVARQPGGAEQRQPLRQRAARGVGSQRGARRGRAARRGPGRRSARAAAATAPAATRRSAGTSASSPARQASQQLGPVGGVGVEQLGQCASHGDLLRARSRWACRAAHHGSPAAASSDLQQRPHRPLRVPRVVVGGHPVAPPIGVGHHRGRGAEGHARADAVAAGRAPSRCDRRCASQRSTPSRARPPPRRRTDRPAAR